MMLADKERGVAILDTMPESPGEDTVFGKRWGSGSPIQISRQELEALLNGKVLAIDVEFEYVVYVQVRKDAGA
ncbi:hypothetical protein ACJU26_03150 [Acidithiobacillus sp. M4-SHS-6]|uniref:hypothetical protein n=1 Tax=Acidithiobacillus sp. M4-SHS-6 TaxID=3383024 RepID=UPI0039BE020F